MSVQFILGRSGSGKTRYCIDAIVRRVTGGSSAQNLVLLVPEQATYQAEKAILSYSGVDGYHGLKVLSFDRLGFWLLGKSAAGSELSRIAQEMVVNRILRANSDKLKIFDQTADMAGVAAKLARIITELQESAMGPEDMQELLAGLERDQPNGITNLKFNDIAVIFENYLKFIADSENNFINPDARLENARQMVSRAPFLKDAFIWVDGFASFTIAQQQLLAEMVKVSNRTQIALCLDPTKLNVNKPKADALDPFSLFAATEHTYLELFNMAKKIAAKITPPVCLGEAKRFESSQDLKTLESKLFSVRKGDSIKHNGDISIVAAPNPRAEVQYVASQVLKLVREDGLRFKDIAVIASDMEAYRHYIEAAFNDYRIAFFIDRTKGLTTHPVVELIGSALAAALEGFSSSDVLAYLKTDLGSVKGPDVDLLENYCIAYGIGNADWTRENKWAFAERNNKLFDEERIDKLRRQAVAPLVRLNEKLDAENVTAEQFVCAVWEFLESLDVREQLADLAGPDPDSEHEHFQFYDKMVSLFDEMTEVFADEMMPAEDFMFIAGNAFSQLVLKQIPPRLDQVLVGSIERSRHPDLKAVFLLGTTQKQFPAALSFDSILTEDDLLAAQSHEFDLKGTLSSRLAERQYLAYIAFTRPSEKLFITYPSSVDGKPVVASAFLNDVKDLFQGLHETTADSRVNIANACTQSQLEDIVCASAGKDSILNQLERQAFYGLIDKLGSVDPLCSSRERITYALKYNNIAALDSKRLKDKTKDLDCSASRLSNFAECPYKHFAKYDLALKKRKQFTFEPVDIGSFYHTVLDGLFKKLKAKGKDFATVQDDSLLKLLSEQIKETIAEDAFYSNFISRGLHNEFILFAAEDILADAVKAYSQMSRAGQFGQKSSENRFGWDNKQQCQFDLPGKAKVRLRGIIDRIDIAKVNGKQTAVVFDYKRSSRSFSWPNLYYGLDMQLAIYLLALKGADVNGQRIEEVAGAFYLPIEANADGEKFVHKAKGLFDGKFADSLDSDAGSGWNKYYNFYNSKDGPYGNYRTSGALRPGSLEDVLAFTTKRVIGLAKQILGDTIKVSPYRLGKNSPCGYCDYRAVCRFDWQVNSYNVLTKLDSKEQVLDQMGGTDGQ
ncbi:MAG: exodeoxyribonuclease V subunit gamma [Planctomycetes bacterium]|nr:exodeoxyribonuclease V subunit gamma [Planctomycetota bacterium]